MTTITKKKAVKKAAPRKTRTVAKGTISKLEQEASDSALKTAMKAAQADTRKDTPEVTQITEDAGEEQALGVLPVADEKDTFMVFENSESLRFAMGQSANSLSYFGLRNLVWVAAITVMDFDEIVTPAKFAPAAKFASDYASYFTRGDSADSATVAGVDRVAGSDEDGRSDIHSADSMDAGTDTRKRLSEAQWDIMSSNADRYLACAAALSRLREYGIEPTQPVADYVNDKGVTVKGTMTRVIEWHTQYVENRRAKSLEQHQQKAQAVSAATDALGESSLSAFGL